MRGFGFGLFNKEGRKQGTGFPAFLLSLFYDGRLGRASGDKEVASLSLDCVNITPMA
jgi:hypothetical protein